MNQQTHEDQLRARFTGQFVGRASSSTERSDVGASFPMHRQSLAHEAKGPATAPGRYQILFLLEGEGNGFTFSRQVLQDSAPIWEGASVFVDHSYWAPQSVRDLGGVIGNAAWSDEFGGLTAELTPAGPSKEIIREAAEITMRDGPSPNVGFSADVVFTADATGNVTRILQPYSVDLVMDPAFATKFIRTINQRRAAPSPRSPWIAERSEAIRGDAASSPGVPEEGQGATSPQRGLNQRKEQQMPEEHKPEPPDVGAALREISALVAAIFTDNSAVGPTLADTGALFNNTAVTTAGGHANLLTTALGTDFTAWDAVAAAMYAQPMLVKNATGYYGTGKAMAIEPRYCLVPRELKAAAEALFIPRWGPVTGATVPAAGSSTYPGYVEPITVPEWTDATDWAAVADPAIMPGIMIGERFGLMPQIFLAGSEIDPAMFANDEQRIKVRHFIAVGVADFRPLHKSNV